MAASTLLRMLIFLVGLVLVGLLLYSYQESLMGQVGRSSDYPRFRSMSEAADSNNFDCSVLNENVRYEHRETIALASFYSSGSPWLKLLLQRATGIVAGSIFYDQNLLEKGLVGGGVVNNVLVVETLFPQAKLTPSSRHSDSSAVATRALILARNPFDVIVGEYSFVMTGEVGRKPNLTRGHNYPHWNDFVIDYTFQYREFLEFWTNFESRKSNSRHLVKFEDLQSDPKAALRSIIEWMHLPVDEVRLECAVRTTPCSLFSLNCDDQSTEDVFDIDHKAHVTKELGSFFSQHKYRIPPKPKVVYPIHKIKENNIRYFPQSCAHDSPFKKSVRRAHEMKVQALQQKGSPEDIERRKRIAEKYDKPPISQWKFSGWHGWGQTGYNGWAGIDMKKPSPKCQWEWREDKVPLEDAYLVLFTPTVHIGDHGWDWCNHEFDFPPVKYPHQKWGFVDYEIAGQFTILGDQELISVFDWEATYRKNESTYHITMNCLTASHRGFLDPPPAKTTGRVAAYVASRCIAWERDLYARELMIYGVKVDSFGICLHNADMPGESVSAWPRNWDLKVDHFGTYKFALVFENDNVTDWITEKFPHAVLAGTVPVYMGAPNVDSVMPGPKSIIKTSDFPNPEALAKYLKFLDENDEEYYKYFDWKKSGKLSPGFQQDHDDCAYYQDMKVCDDLLAARDAWRAGRYSVESARRRPAEVGA